jgi:hypothetical protein
VHARLVRKYRLMSLAFFFPTTFACTPFDISKNWSVIIQYNIHNLLNELMIDRMQDNKQPKELPGRENSIFANRNKYPNFS